MSTTKFSVIIPVYNSERFLDRCIQSVINQSNSSWELILVDDGSSDSSWDKINYYTTNDKRIIGIKQNNKGPGLARNAGIEKATGEYLVFIDSDDYVDAEYFSLLENEVVGKDLAFIDVLRVSEKGEHLQEEKMSIYRNWDRERIIRSMMTGKIPWGGVRKVVKRSIVMEHDIFYTDLKIGEEALFSFKALYYSKSIGFIDAKPVYMYVQRENSQSNFATNDPWGGTYNVLRQYIIKIGKYDIFANTLNAFNVAATVVSIDRMTKMYSDKQEIKKNISNRTIEYLQNYDRNYPIDKKSMSFKARVFIPFLNRGLTLPIVIASRLRRKLVE